MVKEPAVSRKSEAVAAHIGAFFREHEAWYHRNQHLGLGHTFPLGEPWLPGSSCDHALVSLPYPWGPGLEVVPYADEHVHVLWILPITRAEREYKVRHGQEALEQLFDAEGLEYSNVERRCAVPEA